MKKTLVALTILSAAGMASAQSGPGHYKYGSSSSVIIYGVLDAAVLHGSGSGVGSASKTEIGSGSHRTSRLGFRGNEDLGGGLSVSFNLEGQLNVDTGTGARTSTNNQTNGLVGGGGLTFNRRSTVSLSSGLGKLRLGRDYNADIYYQAFFDPFLNTSAGASQTLGVLDNIPGGGTALRASNSISYFLPGNLGGFYGQLQHYLGENTRNGFSTEDDGTGSAVRIGWANGPIDVALATSRTNFATTAATAATAATATTAATAATAATGDIKTSSLGGSYDFGVVKAMALLTHDRFEQPTELTGKGQLIGATVPMGAGSILASYSRYEISGGLTKPESKKYALGYVYNLSKRTTLSAVVAHIANSGGAKKALNGATTAANEGSTGYDFAITHSF